jgi:hypothetical protein
MRLFKRNLSQNHPNLNRDRRERSNQRDRAYSYTDARLRLGWRRYGDGGTG